MLSLDDLYRGFREPEVIRAMASEIRALAPRLPEPLRVMEVCGGHTHTIMKFGLTQLLPPEVEFIHGPGCPVCVMPKERIDQAIALAEQPGVILTTLGDMIRVPGSRGSLAQCRARGADVRPLYDPLDALAIARDNPQHTVIFFAIGFETTTPMSAALLAEAERLGIDNLLLHINHVLVPPAIEAVMAEPACRVNAFIGPSHVSVITGAEIYRPIVQRYRLPLVVSGFEPVDVMEALLMLVRQRVAGRCDLEVQYRRAVTAEGNRVARDLVARYFEVREHFRWRGLGDIPASALRLRGEFAHRDAERRFALDQSPIEDHKACQCADILRGLSKPSDCRVFGRGCDPSRPMGSCMVSSEGACNAYYRYRGLNEDH